MRTVWYFPSPRSGTALATPRASFRSVLVPKAGPEACTAMWLYSGSPASALNHVSNLTASTLGSVAKPTPLAPSPIATLSAGVDAARDVVRRASGALRQAGVVVVPAAGHTYGAHVRQVHLSKLTARLDEFPGGQQRLGPLALDVARLKRRLGPCRADLRTRVEAAPRLLEPPLRAGQDALLVEVLVHERAHHLAVASLIVAAVPYALTHAPTRLHRGAQRELLHGGASRRHATPRAITHKRGACRLSGLAGSAVLCARSLFNAGPCRAGGEALVGAYLRRIARALVHTAEDALRLQHGRAAVLNHEGKAISTSELAKHVKRARPLLVVGVRASPGAVAHARARAHAPFRWIAQLEGEGGVEARLHPLLVLVPGRALPLLNRRGQPERLGAGGHVVIELGQRRLVRLVGHAALDARVERVLPWEAHTARAAPVVLALQVGGERDVPHDWDARDVARDLVLLDPDVARLHESDVAIGVRGRAHFDVAMVPSKCRTVSDVEGAQLEGNLLRREERGVASEVGWLAGKAVEVACRVDVRIARLRLIGPRRNACGQHGERDVFAHLLVLHGAPAGTVGHAVREELIVLS
eukprot:scaffold10334_cov71-Phaeocystis_antarctica.AAC.12